MVPTVEFWFEFASTYSYVAAGRIEHLSGAAGVEVAWRPFLLGPIFQKQGWSDSPFNLYPAKGAYMWREFRVRAGHERHDTDVCARLSASPAR
jgi:2-hydroxychromene-2-carboxylate isomerase